MSIQPSGEEQAYRILVIDDEDSMRRFLAMLLEGKGHTVVSVENGADGIFTEAGGIEGLA